MIYVSCSYRNEAVGGESLLLDSYLVLEDMRVKHPEEFDILTKIPATFQRIHYTRYFNFVVIVCLRGML